MFIFSLFFLLSGASAMADCNFTLPQSSAYFQSRFGDKLELSDTQEQASIGNLGFEDADLVYLCPFKSLVSLQIFNDAAVDKKGLDGKTLSALTSLSELKFLDLDGNHLTGLSLSQLKGLEKLEGLKLGEGNPLGDEGMEAVDNLPALKTLIIQDNGLVSKDLDWLERSQKVFETLDFSKNKSLDGEAIGKLMKAKTQKLVLQDCGINSAQGFSEIVNNKNIISLNLIANPVAAVMKEIAQALATSSNLNELIFNAMIDVDAAKALSTIPNLKTIAIGVDIDSAEAAIPVVDALTTGSIQEIALLALGASKKELLALCNSVQPKHPSVDIQVLYGRATRSCSTLK